MKHFWRSAFAYGAGAILLCTAASTRAVEGKPLSFQEVFSLVSSNLVDAKPAELDHAAALGLINQLQPQVQIVSDQTTNSEKGSFGKTTVIEKSYAIVRLNTIVPGVAQEFRKVFNEFASSNKLKGLVLDLRFANGTDYKAAAEVADQFLSTVQPLYVSGTTNIQSTAKSDAISLPVATLVNQQTSGAPELIAALLRQMVGAVIIGSPTAGGARIFQEYPLSNGQTLRIAKADLQLPGGETLSAAGVKPDIKVSINAEEERSFLDDPYNDGFTPKRPTRGTNEIASAAMATNRVMRRMYNEADLVRRHREGIDVQTLLATGGEARAAINDPALGRAIDFLKGLAVVQQFGKGGK